MLAPIDRSGVPRGWGHIIDLPAKEGEMTPNIAAIIRQHVSLDREWGPGFLKVCTYLPYPVKLCLNGHEWVTQHLARRRIGFESLDNGFLTCTDPATWQAVCDNLGPLQPAGDRESRLADAPRQLFVSAGQEAGATD